jgi:hypothetical protein
VLQPWEAVYFGNKRQIDKAGNPSVHYERSTYSRKTKDVKTKDVIKYSHTQQIANIANGIICIEFYFTWYCFIFFEKDIFIFIYLNR